jgi:hypothetical protein
MSLTFPTDALKKPSELTAIPNQFIRPDFGNLYGFDSFPDLAILTEDEDPMTTEDNEILLFEE